MPVTVCWAAKGGSGTTVVAATLALACRTDSLLVDLDGELPAVLGLPEPAGQGVADWLASDAPPGALADLAVDVDRTTRLVPRGARPVDRRSPPLGRARGVARRAPVHRRRRRRHRRPPPNPLGDVGRTCSSPAPATSPCGAPSPCRAGPTASCSSPSPGGRCACPTSSARVGAPVVATVSLDPAVARAVDAGLLAARLPRLLQRELRGAA